MTNIKPTYQRVYSLLCSRMDGNRQVRISYSEIAKEFSFDKRTALRHTRVLANNNLLRVIPTTGDNRQGLLYEVL